MTVFPEKIVGVAYGPTLRHGYYSVSLNPGCIRVQPLAGSKVEVTVVAGPLASQQDSAAQTVWEIWSTVTVGILLKLFKLQGPAEGLAAQPPRLFKPYYLQSAEYEQSTNTTRRLSGTEKQQAAWLRRPRRRSSRV